MCLCTYLAASYTVVVNFLSSFHMLNKHERIAHTHTHVSHHCPYSLFAAKMCAVDILVAETFSKRKKRPGTCHSFIQSVSQSARQPVSQSIIHSVSQSVSQSAGQSDRQSVSQTDNQSDRQSVSQLNTSPCTEELALVYVGRQENIEFYQLNLMIRVSCKMLRFPRYLGYPYQCT